MELRHDFCDKLELASAFESRLFVCVCVFVINALKSDTKRTRTTK